MDAQVWASNLSYHEWVAAPVLGSRPFPRYKHAAAIVDQKLCVFGGSLNGRFLDDLQVLDLDSLSWSILKINADKDSDNVEGSEFQEVLSATSGHCLVQWGRKLLMLGGNSKIPSDKMIVRFIDLETRRSGIIKTSGNIPVARVGSSATLVESKLIIFGGEDKNKKLLNDTCVLNLETMSWDYLETTQTPPAPRFDHIAAVHSDRYLLIFSGCSHSILFNDLHVLDLQTMEWSKPEIDGDFVTPRAGHAGATINGNWYIVGGGDNKRGCCETLQLNMSTFSCSRLSTVHQRDPLASEGLTVCSAAIGGEIFLVAFGGYNGKYNNETFFMRLKQQEIPQPKIYQSPAAAAAAASVTAAYALAKSEALEQNRNSAAPESKESAVDAIRDEKNRLQQSLAEIEAENSRMRGRIDELDFSHAEMSKELQSVEGQLVAERSRCFKLEAQIAELRKGLEQYDAVEKEVQQLWRHKAYAEDSAAPQPHAAWRWTTTR